LLSDNWMDILLSGSYAGFYTEKSVLLLDRVVRWIGEDKDIVLDSFTVSCITAYAVLYMSMSDCVYRKFLLGEMIDCTHNITADAARKMNKAHGGNLNFILVEMMYYADNITAERVKRVIDGYGEGKKAVKGTGGNFSYYELGPVLLMPDGNLHEEVRLQKIRE